MTPKQIIKEIYSKKIKGDLVYYLRTHHGFAIDEVEEMIEYTLKTYGFSGCLVRKLPLIIGWVAFLLIIILCISLKKHTL
jgi:hypothetical protein